MAGPVRFRPTRAYPGIPTISGDTVSHSRALEAIKQAIEIHERRTRNYLDSFVTLRDLVDVGLITLKGDQFNLVPIECECDPLYDVGASEFIGLSDVPGSYAGSGGNLVAVNGYEDGLEFISGLDDSLLSSNVALLDRDPQEFTGDNTFSGAFTATTALNGGYIARFENTSTGSSAYSQVSVTAGQSTDLRQLNLYAIPNTYTVSPALTGSVAMQIATTATPLFILDANNNVLASFETGEVVLNTQKNKLHGGTAESLMLTRNSIDSPFISFYKADESARIGYLQMQNEGAASLMVEVAQTFSIGTGGTARTTWAGDGSVVVNVVGEDRMANDSAYRSFYNSAGTVRRGYMQFTGSAGYISSEVSGSPLYIGTTSAPVIFSGDSFSTLKFAISLTGGIECAGPYGGVIGATNVAFMDFNTYARFGGYNTSTGAQPMQLYFSTLHLASLPGHYANDASAAAGGVAVNEVYRNGNVLMVRVS